MSRIFSIFLESEIRFYNKQIKVTEAMIESTKELNDTGRNVLVLEKIKKESDYMLKMLDTLCMILYFREVIEDA
ncbi:MAG: hypothetical protein ACRC92_27385 [Peptostreptococcaceae bacterium]